MSYPRLLQRHEGMVATAEIGTQGEVSNSLEFVKVFLFPSAYGLQSIFWRVFIIIGQNLLATRN